MPNKIETKSVMIFSPHPDDAEIAMGGSIALMLDEGWLVFLVDITNGEPTPAGNPKIRAAEARQASQTLGITKRICLELPNRFLENKLEYRRALAVVIREHKPNWLLTPFGTDAHPDHVHAASLTEEARFVAKLSKTDLLYEPHYPEKIIYYYASHLRLNIQPSFVVDISNQWERKINAIKAYQSQFWHNQLDPKRKGWIIDHIEAVCRYFGNRIGAKYAEPFYCHELMGLSTLGSLL